MNSLEEIAALLKEKDDYIIVGHTIPDGDCIGSMLALGHALGEQGKQVALLLADPVPVRYHYLPGWEMIKRPAEWEKAAANLIFVDCADQERVGEEVAALISGASPVFNLDHHLQGELFGDYNYVEPGAAATAEIIYGLLQAMSARISKTVAKCLYAAIIMDTGGFMNSNTTPTTMRITANLLELGADVDQARVELFESKPRLEVLLLGLALKHIEFSDDGRIAWMSLPYSELEALGAVDFHPEGIITYTRMIAGVEVGLLFRETKPGQVKVGFRSKGDTDVAAIAALYGGGGHRQAAGVSLAGNLEEVKLKVIKTVEDVIA